MKTTSNILEYIHLDKGYCLLTGKNVRIIFEIFTLLDIHEIAALNDIQFVEFMLQITNLSKAHIYKVFDMLDVDGSGELDFDEFYLLMCILIAIKDGQEKQFIYRHSRTVFDLLDEDGSNAISAEEFENFGFLFNFHGDAIKGIFNEFDVSGDSELDYKEFRMFAMACIDKQNEIDRKQKEKLEEKRIRVENRNKKKLLQQLKKRGLVPQRVTKTHTDEDEAGHLSVRTETTYVLGPSAEGSSDVCSVL